MNGEVGLGRVEDDQHEKEIAVIVLNLLETDGEAKYLVRRRATDSRKVL